MFRCNSLDARSRASLFTQLAQTERAGLPILEAIAILSASANRSLESRLSRFKRAISTGKGIAAAGLDSGLFLPWEARLLEAAERSAQLAQSYAALSKRYTQRVNSAGKVTRGLILPLFLFVLMVLLNPLKDLLVGDISGLEYSMLTAGRIILFFGGLYLLRFYWRRLAATGADNTLFRWLLRIPWVGGLIRDQQRRDFLHSLALLIEAGVAAFDALGIAAQSVSHPLLRKQFAASEKNARRGATVSEALESCGAFHSSHAANLVHTGEVAGRLDEMLHHQAQYLNEQIDMRLILLAEWAPRMVYLLILLLFILG